MNNEILERGVTGNTPGLGPGKSRFESLRSSHNSSCTIRSSCGDVRPAVRIPDCDSGDAGSNPVHPPTCRTGRAVRRMSAKRSAAGANPACDSTWKGQPIGDGSAVLTRRAISLVGSTPAPSSNELQIADYRLAQSTICNLQSTIPKGGDLR